MNNEIERVYNLFSILSQIDSTNSKVEFIRQNKDDEMFLEVLKFVYDKSFTTNITPKGLADKRVVERSNMMCGNSEETLKSLLEYVKTHNTGKLNDLGSVLNKIGILSSKKEYLKKFLIEMVSKSIKIGANVKLINKAIPDFIYEWKVQLGSSQEKLKLKPNESFTLTQKLNGVRATYCGGKLITRQGKEICGVDHIIKDISEIFQNSPLKEITRLTGNEFCLDGELIRRNIDNVSDNENFRKTASLVNNQEIEDKSELQLLVFDMFLNPRLKVEECQIISKIDQYETRRLHLDMLFSQQNTQNKSVLLLPILYYGNDKSKIDYYLNYANLQGWEGLMLNKNIPYEFKRTTGLIKIKSFHEVDLRCLEVHEGEGKYSGTLGAITVNYKGNKVQVGSGFTDEQRKYYWENQEQILDKIVTVKYKEESKNKDNNLLSLQFPVFMGVRTDKDEESYD